MNNWWDPLIEWLENLFSQEFQEEPWMEELEDVERTEENS